MFFKNLMIFRLPKNLELTKEVLEEQLTKSRFEPCLPSAPFCEGWTALVENGALVHAVGKQWFLSLRESKRLLPSSVVKAAANERAKAIEEAEGRRVGQKEMREIKESKIAELLPKSHVVDGFTQAWIDPVNGWFAVNASSKSKAEKVLESVRKCVDGFPLKLVRTVMSPSAAMTLWLSAGEPPAGFSIDQDCVLKSAEKATIRYTHHTLEGDDPKKHLAEGKVPTQLALTWNDRISFVLAEDGSIKRLDFLDILKAEAAEAGESKEELFDADLTIMTGELARLLADLVQALGGEEPANG